MTKNFLKNGGQILVDCLLTHGVTTAFCVPGESYLAVLDGLYDVAGQLRLITCRQEGGAAYMAEAYGKLTGEPGICFVTRGPGASNAAIGLHTAFQDSSPMILFIGQVASDQVEREAFQEVDYRRMFGQMAKWVTQIDDAARIPEYIAHAFQVATSGRPGPVVLALPEDVLTSLAEALPTRRYQPVAAHPGMEDMAKLRQMLAEAQRPLVILGGSGWSGAACADIQSFIKANNLPTGAAFRFQDLIDNRLVNYVGDIGIGINPKLAERIKQADLILAIGPRLGEMTTSGYTLINIPVPHQKLIHIHAGAEELGRVYQADLMINAGMKAFAAAARALKPVDHSAWETWAAEARADFELWSKPVPSVGAVDLGQIYETLNARLPENTILTNGAGNYASWLHRFFQYKGFRSQLAPTNGSMGYGVPSAVAAKVVCPDRPVISFSGDGCFLMNGQELATAVQYKLPIVFLVFNNGMYGTIRMHQEREYPQRVSGTELTNPDFAALARAYGAGGETVNETAEFAPALERALKAQMPTLIEIKVDPEALTPRATLSQIRAAALVAHPKNNCPKE
jgi:acetolactate synthase-1/2/3 large subunit